MIFRDVAVDIPAGPSCRRSTQAATALVFLLLSYAAVADVVVYQADARGRAMQAGVSLGDVIDKVEIRRPGRSEDIAFDDPLDFYAAATNEGWRSTTWLHVRGRALPLAVPAGDWGLTVRPTFTDTEQARFDDLLEVIRGGALPGDDVRFLTWRDALLAANAERLAAWLSAALGEALIRAGNEDGAAEYFGRPLGARSAQLPVALRVMLLERQGMLVPPGRPLSARRKALEDAIELQEPLKDDYRLAKLLVHVTSVRGMGGDMPGAIEAAERAVRLAEAAAPESLIFGMALTNLSTVRQIVGDDSMATEAVERAIALYHRIDAPADELAGALMNRGIQAYRRGELALAEAYYAESLATIRQVSYARVNEARTLNNLSLVMRERGNLRAARETLVQALTINRDIDPESLSIQRNLDNLAYLDLQLGDIDAAAAAFGDARELFERRSPDSTELGNTYSALANIAALRGQETEARKLFELATAHMERIAPGSLVLADVLESHARYALGRDDGDLAASLLERVREIRQEKAPDSVEFAQAEILAAQAARLDGRSDDGFARLDTAMRILRRDAADSLYLADAWFVAYELQLDAGDIAAARQSLAAAMDVLDRQRRWLPSGDAAQRNFSDRFRRIYEAAAELAAEAGDAEAVLVVIERYRARSLLAAVSAHDLFADLSAESTTERENLTRRYRELRQRAEHAGGEEKTALEEQARHLNLQRAAWDDRLRQRRDAESVAPDLPDIRSLAETLNSAESALVYFSLPDSLLVLVVSSGAAPRMMRIELNPKDLQEQVRRFRYLLSRGAVDQAPHRVLLELGNALYEQLVAPAVVALDPAAPLAIIPDGTLFALPFAALVTRLDPAPHYLVEERGLRMVQSLSVHAALAGRPRSQPELELVAVTDSGLGARDALPGARREAAYLQQIYAGRQTRFLIGNAADERAVLEAGASTRHLHIATHATAHRAEPLDAWLDIADGSARLEAWEIVDGMHLPGSLVTLSACETAVGQVVDAEGAISLARAFQSAGARDVVATLWRVPDQSTAELMRQFHLQLNQGLPIEESLRAAQLALLEGPTAVAALPGDGAVDRWRRRFGQGPRIDARHPYFWAAFQAIGPGRSVY